jgi:hypothetical protein
VTFTLSPADGSSPSVWAIFFLSGLSGGFIPLCEPHPYVPYDPMAPQTQPSREQTASFLSLVSYSFLDRVVAASTRVDHLGLDMLPPQMDTDDLEALKPSAYPLLDPFYHSEARDGKPRRVRVLWGILAVFRSSWALQALLSALSPALRLGAPLGMNRLLAYIETNGADAVVRPWVWIAWISLAPFVYDVLGQLIQGLNARLVCQLEALLTALVYDHALRVRVVNRPDDVTGVAVAVPSSGPKQIGSADGSGTLSRTDSSATSATVVSSTSGSPKGKANGKAEKTKGKDLVGKLNNLVTSGEWGHVVDHVFVIADEDPQTWRALQAATDSCLSWWRLRC